jgi:hypothetical protein
VRIRRVGCNHSRKNGWSKLCSKECGYKREQFEGALATIKDSSSNSKEGEAIPGQLSKAREGPGSWRNLKSMFEATHS